jgi:hypothetical protein
MRQVRERRIERGSGSYIRVATSFRTAKCSSKLEIARLEEQYANIYFEDEHATLDNNNATEFEYRSAALPRNVYRIKER